MVERVRQLEDACSTQNEEVCQVAGKALGYPWFKDDQKNFPGSTEENGVCVGEHVAESIVDELARKYTQALERVEFLERALGQATEHVRLAEQPRDGIPKIFSHTVCYYVKDRPELAAYLRENTQEEKA